MPTLLDRAGHPAHPERVRYVRHVFWPQALPQCKNGHWHCINNISCIIIRSRNVTFLFSCSFFQHIRYLVCCAERTSIIPVGIYRIKVLKERFGTQAEPTVFHKRSKKHKMYGTAMEAIVHTFNFYPFWKFQIRGKDLWEDGCHHFEANIFILQYLFSS